MHTFWCGGTFGNHCIGHFRNNRKNGLVVVRFEIRRDVSYAQMPIMFRLTTRIFVQSYDHHSCRMNCYLALIILHSMSTTDRSDLYSPFEDRIHINELNYITTSNAIWIRSRRYGSLIFQCFLVSIFDHVNEIQIINKSRKFSSQLTKKHFICSIPYRKRYRPYSL